MRGNEFFFLVVSLTLASRLLPSKHRASRRPLPSIFTTWAYSWPSSLKVSSRRWSSFSLVPRLRFLPPCRDGRVSDDEFPSVAARRATTGFVVVVMVGAGHIFGFGGCALRCDAEENQ